MVKEFPLKQKADASILSNSNSLLAKLVLLAPVLLPNCHHFSVDKATEIENVLLTPNHLP